MKKIEANPAIWWYCEDCGKENFERLILDESYTKDYNQMMLNNIEEAFRDNDINTDDIDEISCEIMLFPEIVECKHCGTKFEILSPNESPEGFDDFLTD